MESDSADSQSDSSDRDDRITASHSDVGSEFDGSDCVYSDGQSEGDSSDGEPVWDLYDYEYG